MVADKITTLIITDRHHAPFATFEQQMADLLSSKRRGTFLPQKMELGRLVTRGTGNRLSADLRRNSDGRLKFGFGRDTTMRITEIETNEMGQLAGHKATFLPTKEILSIFDAIVAARESQEIASFDDTYHDLVQDFRQPTVGGNYDTLVFSPN